MIVNRLHLSAAVTALAVLLAGCARPGEERSTGTVEAADGVSNSVVPSSAPGAAASPQPTAAGCPPEGVRAAVGTGDAAAGLRVLGITLTNCGKGTYTIDGYPVVRSLDEDRTALDVKVLKGVGEITGPNPDWDAPPKPVTLKPGQQAAFVVAWRNTYDDLSQGPVTVRHLEVAPLAGRPVQVIDPDGGLDLGSTGRIGVSAWQLVADPTASHAGPPV
ncbi:DUF4232 domain-containing protein [Actinoplanes sp. NPDC020271]|uniref:DUF4232 domain-containing protein n=1 Tax=Actinoplanes sp. NPDC020271 TaxID=3363896 RepID=UPI0037B0774F